MPYETIEVRKVTPAIGAEISGVDLAGPLSNRQVSELHDALMAHQVIFFRDQQMNVDQHKAFGRLFRRASDPSRGPGRGRGPSRDPRRPCR